MKNICKFLLLPLVIISCLMLTGCSDSENEALYDLSCEKGYEGSFKEWTEDVNTKYIIYRFIDNDIEWKFGDNDYEVFYKYSSDNDFYEDLVTDTWEQYYSVSFYDEDTLIEVKKVKSGNSVYAPSFNVSGYEVKWYLNDTQFVFSTKINAPITLNTKLSLVTYYISYELNGGSVTGNPTNYTVESTNELINPTKAGYTFAGWSLNGEVYETFTFDANTGDLDFVATWKEASIEVEYEVTGVASSNVTTYKYSDGEVLLDLPVKIGFQLNYWYIGTNTNDKVYFLNEEVLEKAVNGKVTLTASYNKIDITTEGNYQYLNFGVYPTSKVEDATTIASLNTLTTTNELGYYELSNKQYYKNESGFYLVESIKWRVLTNGDTLEVVSDVVLDYMSFSAGSNVYANSSIREFLNDDFINMAFTFEEQYYINSTTVETNVKDKVYLLSSDDCNTFSDLKASATDFVTDKGAAENLVQKAYTWWTRSTDGSNVACYSGALSYIAASDNLSVRPAFTFGSN